MAFVCAACAGPVQPYVDPALSGTPACPTCRADPLLQGRYRLEEVVGRGAMGVTYRATRVADGAQVAIKELPLRHRPTLKEVELFEREAAVLRQLSHPGIPAYLEDFTAGSGKSFALYLVQELIAGQTLAEEMASHRTTEVEVLAVVDELLGVLGYLHGLSPPVVHRDLKPENVMRRTSASSGAAVTGGLVLLDFGSVRDAIKSQGSSAASLGGSTVTGTFGFMAPEQLRGQASPASDLYALGVLALVLLTRQRPETLMDAQNQLRWQHLQLGPRATWLLGRLLQAEPERRPQSALAFRAELSGRLGPSAPATDSLRPPLSITPGNVQLSPLRGLTAPVATLWPTLAVVTALSFLGVAGIIGLSRSRTNRPIICASGPCQPLPRGLAGLRFGMTPVEARAALPDQQDPGHPVKTSVFGLPATCDLEFAVQDRLSRMRCTLDPAPTLARHRAQEELIADQLIRTHGQAVQTRTAPEVALLGADQSRLRGWRDDQAEVELRSYYQPLSEAQQRLSQLSGAPSLAARQKLTITNLAQEHRRRQHEIAAARDRAALLARQRREEQLSNEIRREKERLRQQVDRPAR